MQLAHPGHHPVVPPAGRPSRVSAATLAVALAASVATLAHAQEGDPAAAAELFAQGRLALLSKDYDVACAKLAESGRLDRKVGTLINLAQCEQGRGRLRASLAQWEMARTLAHDTSDAREPYIVEQLAAIAPRVPAIHLTLSADAPADTQVSMDGAPFVIAGGDKGRDRVEVGSHVISVNASGRTARTFDVAVREGELRELVVEPGATIVAAAPAAKGAPFWTAQRAAALTGASLGVVGAVVASVFGAQAIEARNEKGCSDGLCDTAAEAQVQRDGMTSGNVATALFIGSGVLLAGAAALWFTAPSAPPRGAVATSVGVAPSHNGAFLAAQGVW